MSKKLYKKNIFNPTTEERQQWKLLREEASVEAVLNQLFDEKITKATVKYMRKGGKACTQKVYGAFDEIQKVVTEHPDWNLQAVEAEVLRTGSETKAFFEMVAKWSNDTDAYEKKLIETARFFEQNPQANKRLITRLVPVKSETRMDEETQQRILKHGEDLYGRVKTDVLQMAYDGVNPKTIEREILKDAKIRAKEATRLTRTEAAREYTKQRNEIMEKAHVKYVEILMETDACEKCQQYKGVKFLFHTEPQVPIHPNCRCCVIPVDNLRYDNLPELPH